MSSCICSLLLTLTVVLALGRPAAAHFASVEQQKVLQFTNAFRSGLATRHYPAANIQEVFWDHELAALAQRDVAKCAVVSPPKKGVAGIAIFLQTYRRVEDLLHYMRRDAVTRPYLAKATFTRMGCAKNTTDCVKGHEVICYWYPQCGSLYNAFEEGPAACHEFLSTNSRNYKALCVRRPAAENQTLSQACEHRTRSVRPSAERAGKSADTSSLCPRSPEGGKQSAKMGDEKTCAEKSVMKLLRW